MSATQAAVSIIVALITLAGGWATARFGRKGERENALIDQLQEERAADREEFQREREANDKRFGTLTEKVDRLEREVMRLLGRDALWQMHATRLEDQVHGLGAVPHERPAELR